MWRVARLGWYRMAPSTSRSATEASDEQSQGLVAVGGQHHVVEPLRAPSEWSSTPSRRRVTLATGEDRRTASPSGAAMASTYRGEPPATVRHDGWLP